MVLETLIIFKSKHEIKYMKSKLCILIFAFIPKNVFNVLRVHS